MASWHQSRNRIGHAAMYTPPVKGYRVVIDSPNQFAYSVEFTNKRKATAFAKRTGGLIIQATRA